MNTRFDPELSRLAFEDRLIEFCEDPTIPVLERVRLLAIFWERLDVFFLTRVGRLKRLAATREPKAAAQTPPEEQLASIAVEGNRMVRRAYELCGQLLSELATHDIHIERFDALVADLSVDDDMYEFRRRLAAEAAG